MGYSVGSGVERVPLPLGAEAINEQARLPSRMGKTKQMAVVSKRSQLGLLLFPVCLLCGPPCPRSKIEPNTCQRQCLLANSLHST
jgi:hypothetical protein